MASFLTDWLKRAIANDDFAWPFSDVRVLLIGDPDYDPLPTPHTVDGLLDAELDVAGYERKSITSRELGGVSFGGTDGVSTWLCDDVTFPALPAVQVRGAWVIDYRFAADNQSFFVAWLDLGNGGTIGVGGDLKISFPDGRFAAVRAG